MVSSTEMLILLGLAKGEAYGRELIDTIAALPNSKRLSLGTFYPTIARLEKRGLVTGRWGDDSEIREGARRRYYSLTAEGLRALHETRARFVAVDLLPLPNEG